MGMLAPRPAGLPLAEHGVVHHGQGHFHPEKDGGDGGVERVVLHHAVGVSTTAGSSTRRIAHVHGDDGATGQGSPCEHATLVPPTGRALPRPRGVGLHHEEGLHLGHMVLLRTTPRGYGESASVPWVLPFGPAQF